MQRFCFKYVFNYVPYHHLITHSCTPHYVPIVTSPGHSLSHGHGA